MLFIGAFSLSLYPESAHCAFNARNAGTSAGEFLKLGSDSRGAALGEAMTALSDDASAIYFNPAGLSQLNQRQLSMTHSALYQDVFFEFAAYAHPVQPLVPARRREFRPSGRGTLAAALLYLNAGRLQEIDNTGLKTGGAFTPRDLALLAGWGASLTETFDFGLALKYVDSRITSSARTGAIDVGARLRLHLYDFPFTLAANARNMGGRLNYRNQSDPLPQSYRLGSSLRPIPNWRLAFDLAFPRDNGPYPAFGTEADLPWTRDIRVTLRGGWSGRVAGDVAGLAGISLGAGFGRRAFDIDYAWVPFGFLGNTHRFSLGYKF